jgi:hypothetical protein
MPAGPSFVWWVTSEVEKVRPDDPPPSKSENSVHIFAARNEFEPFQIVLRAERQDVRNVDIAASDLKGPGGALISKQNITVYFEPFIKVETPSSVEGNAGEWPDPLIPQVDRYYGERRNAFPFNLTAGRNQPIWCEVYVPPSARSGDYAGQVAVSVDGKAGISIPLSLTVWNFALPATSSFTTSFGLNGVSAVRQHKGRYTNDRDLYALAFVYRKAALWHRLSIHGGSMAPPQLQRRSGRLQVDWTAYDAETAPFLDGSVFSAGDPLAGARATSVDLRDAKGLANDRERTQYYQAFADHFRRKGWFDRLFFYLWDEPKPPDSTELLLRGNLIHTADAQLHNLLTTSFRSSWSRVTNIWVPLINCFESRPGFPDYCQLMVERDAYSAEIARGKQLWWYQSCSSHGCASPGGEYFRGWPSYMIDYQVVANRIMPWLAWKYGIRGELYYNLNEAYVHKGDPWTSVYLFGGNGDGTLVYPGRPDKVGGKNDIPIESIRLKLIREGLEDYEYLTMLQRKVGYWRTAEIVDSFVRGLYDYDQDPHQLYAARRRAGEELSR